MVYLFIYFKFGNYIVNLTDMESALKVRKAFQDFSDDLVKSLNEKKEPIDRMYFFFDEKGYGISIWMGQVAGIHIAPYKENPQEKIANALEKHIGEGDEWKEGKE